MLLTDFLRTKSISDADFARQIGVERQAVHRYRLGLRFPSRSILARITEVTDGAVTANDFVETPANVAEDSTA